MKEVAKAFLGNRMEQIQQLEEGDYIGDDGLIYCGKCHTKKQTIVNLPESLFGKERTGVFKSLCKCQQDKMQKEKEKEEFDERMRAIQRMKDASMMDSVFREASFSRYQVNDSNREIYRMAKNYADSFDKMYSENQGILIYGPVGTGKSYTAACIANQLIERRIPVVMTSFVKIMQNTGINGQDEQRYLKTLNSSKLLILDDLGAERNTDYALEKVYNIIDSRSRAQKPMILTTNLDLADMMNIDDIRYQRIYDRIFETCYPIRLDGTSFRKNSAATRFDRMKEFMNE